MNESLPEDESLSEEQLSAYLDGELLHEERQRVEQWLAESGEHRRLHDELLALRRELQALPAHSLDAGFSDRVLAAIRSRTEPSTSSLAAESTPVIAPASTVEPALGIPAWRWFAAGVAASFAAMLLGMNYAPQTMTQIGLLPAQTEVAASVEAPVPAQITPLDRNRSFESPVPVVETEFARKEHAPSEQRKDSGHEIRDEAQPRSLKRIASEDQAQSLQTMRSAEMQLDQAQDFAEAPLQEESPSFNVAPPAAAFRGANRAAMQKAATAEREAGIAETNQLDGVEPSFEVRQWLDAALARNDGAVLELDLALQANSAEGFEKQMRQRRASDQQSEENRAQEKSKSYQAESLNRFSASAEPLEISGSREEVERLLTALGTTQLVEARFVTTNDAQGRDSLTRKSLAMRGNLDRASGKLESDEVQDSKTDAVAKPELAAAAAPAPAPIPAPLEAPAIAADAAFAEAEAEAEGKSRAALADKPAPVKPGAGKPEAGGSNPTSDVVEQSAMGDFGFGGGGGTSKPRVRIRLHLLP